MSTDKGKGKAKAPTNQNKPNSEDNGDSMFSRITASASGLTHNLLSGTDSNESIIGALANSRKSQSSSATGSGDRAWTASTIKTHPIYVPPGGHGSIKLGHGEEHEKIAEAEFAAFLNGADISSSSEPSGTMGADSYRDIGTTWGKAWAHAQTIDTPEFSTPEHSRTVAQQEALDGQEVLDLLLGQDLKNEGFEAAPEDDAPEDYDWGLSPDQISQIRVMTTHLAAPNPHASTDIDHPLNLVPSLDLDGRMQWIEQWDNVLKRYADEVWGGLLPLVKEARQEVEIIRKENTISSTPTALRRLEAILGHLQQR